MILAGKQKSSSQETQLETRNRAQQSFAARFGIPAMLVARRKGKFVGFFFQDVHLVNISPCDLLGSPLQNFRCLLLECHIHRDSDPSRDGESLIYVRMLRQRLLLEQQQQKTTITIIILIILIVLVILI